MANDHERQQWSHCSQSESGPIEQSTLKSIHGSSGRHCSVYIHIQLARGKCQNVNTRVSICLGYQENRKSTVRLITVIHPHTLDSAGGQYHKSIGYNSLFNIFGGNRMGVSGVSRLYYTVALTLSHSGVFVD